MSQEVLLVDLAHLIPRYLLHQHQACGDGVGRHVLPAKTAPTNTDVKTLKTVYCRKEIHTDSAQTDMYKDTHTHNTDACAHMDGNIHAHTYAKTE